MVIDICRNMGHSKIFLDEPIQAVSIEEWKTRVFKEGEGLENHGQSLSQPNSPAHRTGHRHYLNSRGPGNKGGKLNIC